MTQRMEIKSQAILYQNIMIQAKANSRLKETLFTPDQSGDIGGF